MLAFAGARPAHVVLRAALALTLLLGQLCVSVRPVMAQQQQQSGEVVLKSPQAIVIDAETGAVLFQRNADELTPPASMSKLMLLVMMLAFWPTYVPVGGFVTTSLASSLPTIGLIVLFWAAMRRLV